MAHISFQGRVIGQPDLKFSQAGKAYLRFRTVENSRRQVNGEWQDVGSAWGDVTVFGNQAEHLAEALNDKDVVTVAGRLDAREWERQDGTKQTSYEVVADVVGIVPARQQSSPGFQQPPGQPARNTGWTNAQTGQPADPWGRQSGSTDNPPF